MPLFAFLENFTRRFWGILNCRTGEMVTVEKLPFEIGSGNGLDLKIEGEGIYEQHCDIRNVHNKGVCLVPRNPSAIVILNGTPSEFRKLMPNKDYTLQIGEHLFAIRGCRSPTKWRTRIDFNNWQATTKSIKTIKTAPDLQSLIEIIRAQDWNAAETIVRPKGLTAAFGLDRLLPYMKEIRASHETAMTQGLEGRAAHLQVPAIPPPVPVQDIPDKGSFTCPTCWLHFDEGNVMHVASHDSLRGDPLLGEDAPLRFHATHFNDKGQALDAKELPCLDIACPHCRRKLPNGFLQLPNHIFSIVGAPSAGKSYYLSVLAHLLPQTLYKNFDLVFQDADPTGNALLNDMRGVLFSARKPEEALLAKTALEGEMYERLPRHGKTVALPKPFIFTITSEKELSHSRSIVFYDNAGEHFEPGRDQLESPGAQHVANSAGIFFLFDPTASESFRRQLVGHPDPQLSQSHIKDQQDVILTETKIRIQSLLGLGTHDKIQTPLAVLIGKCDVWLELIGRQNLSDPVRNGYLCTQSIARNSQLVRDFLLEVQPTIVANAESISQEVMYFPVSALGHSPMKLPNGRVAPDPQLLRPMFVDVPTLWVLSKIDPVLVPDSSSPMATDGNPPPESVTP